MAYKLSISALDSYIKTLSEHYRVIAPVMKKSKGAFSDTDLVTYDVIESVREIIVDQKSYFSPKEFLTPVRETLFYFHDGDTKVPSFNEKPLLVIGRACDLNGLARQDNMYLNNGDNEDYYYARRRTGMKTMLLECTEGFDTCFCVSMESNTYKDYDAALRLNNEDALLEVVSEELMDPILEKHESAEFHVEFIRENTVKVTIPQIESVTKDVFEHDIWKEYTRRCIACGRCNTSCVTCTCFTMQDVRTDDNFKLGERRRIWASCHVDGYTDMAGGHGFRDKNGARMRFKTMHKINDYYKRFGEHMCVGCGRCDDVCPEYISFSKCINKVNQIIEEGN